MAPTMGTTTKQPTSNQGHLQSLMAKVRKELRPPTQIETSYATNLTQAVEKEAWKESQEVRDSMLGLAQEARRMFGLRPFDMSLNRENEADGKEMVLRNGGKRSASTAPAPNPSKRQQREPIRPPPPPHSGKIDQKSETLDQSSRVRHIKEENTVTNSQNGPHGHGHSQSIENPSATSFLTSSAPIYNQNINSGSGQQNINVYGVFEPPPPPATGAAPTEYEIPTEPEHRLNRDAGQQRFSINDTVTNKTAGDGNPGGHKQTLKGPHGNTHMRMTAPVYNQNVNTGSGQQNIDVVGKMDFEKKDRKERPRQDHVVAVGQPANPQPQRRDDQGPGNPHYDRGPSYRPTSPQGLAVATGQNAIPLPQRRDNEAPRSPFYRPASSHYRPTSPQYGSTSPEYRPTSPHYRPTSPQYSYGPTSLHRRSRSPRRRVAAHSDSGAMDEYRDRSYGRGHGIPYEDAPYDSEDNWSRSGGVDRSGPRTPHRES